MIKLAKMTDYAIVIMGQLASEGESVSCSARLLSDKTGVPEPTVAKILKRLAREKLVVSARGASGGYKLLNAPVEISICRIIEAMEGPLAIVSCAGGNGESCKISVNCCTRGNWSLINTAIRSALEGVMLSDMIAQSAPAFVQIPSGVAR